MAKSCVENLIGNFIKINRFNLFTFDVACFVFLYCTETIPPGDSPRKELVEPRRASTQNKWVSYCPLLSQCPLTLSHSLMNISCFNPLRSNPKDFAWLRRMPSFKFVFLYRFQDVENNKIFYKCRFSVPVRPQLTM